MATHITHTFLLAARHCLLVQQACRCQVQLCLLLPLLCPVRHQVALQLQLLGSLCLWWLQPHLLRQQRLLRPPWRPPRLHPVV